MKYFYLTWSNLKRKKLRTILTLLSIIVAFVLFGILSAIKHAFTGGVQVAGVDRLMTIHRVSLIQPLPLSYEARMERIPGVRAATHMTWFGGYYQESKNMFFTSPVNPEEFLSMFPEYIVPEDQQKAWLATRTGAIIGEGLAKKYKWKVGDRVPIISPIFEINGSQTWEFNIVGIYKGKNENTDTTGFFFRYDYFDEARQEWAKGSVGWYSLRVEDPAKAAEVAKKVDEEFMNSPAETKTEPEGVAAQGFINQIGNIALITSSILAAVFFTILLVTGNTMAQAVRERTGEIGVLKAIGFTSKQVLAMVLLESCLLTVIGGGIGLGIAWLIAASGDPTKGMLPLFYFPRRDVMIGVGIAILLGIITGIVPAVQAMNLRVANALRRM